MVSCTCAIGAPSSRPMSGSDARYISTDSGPMLVSRASSNVSGKVPGRSIKSTLARA